MARAYWHSKDWGGKRPGAGRPRPGPPTRSLSITLPENLIEALDQEADQCQMTRSAVVVQHLMRGLAKSRGGAKTKNRAVP